MRIEVWADVVCPWCAIGLHRLDLALDRFAHRDAVEIVHRSYQLDPGAPADRVMPVADVLRRRYGLDEERIAAAHRRVESLAAADGLAPFHAADNVVGHTGRAHQLLAFAADRGLGDVAWRRVLHAYWVDRRSVFDVDSLVILAAETGLDVDEARAVLGSLRYAERIREDQLDATELGATGVPFFVIDRLFVLSGAHPVDRVLRALDHAWAESAA